MKRQSYFPALLLAATVMVASVSCDGDSGPANKQANTANANQDVAQDVNEVGTEQTDDEQQTETKKTLCDIITNDDLAAITGTQYTEVNSTANFNTIKHCEYRSGDMKNHISLAVSFGSTASQIMEKNKLFPKLKPVDGFGEEAIWESVRGNLTVLSKDRCFDVKVSQTHGDDSTRLDFAKKIAELAMQRL